MSKGLSTATAQEKLNRYGPNEFSFSPKKHIGKIFKEVITEPMIFLLICCAILYFILGNNMESAVLLIMIGMIVFISVTQRTRSEKALEKLQSLSSPRALVIRDGTPIRIPGSEVVPHDVCIVTAGDRIPADGKIIQSSFLLVNEAILTGESNPVEKSLRAGENLLYAGTLVQKGTAYLFITSTGKETKFGQIGKSLHSIHKRLTPLQSAVKKIVRQIGVIAIVVSLGLTILIYLKQHNAVMALLNGLATAMALIPEEFPVIMTVFLALGAWRLSKINVLTRDPAVIETLGSTDVLCVDKTGTLTENNMKLKYIADNKHIFAPDEFINTSVLPLLKAVYYATDKDSLEPTEKGIYEYLPKLKEEALTVKEHRPFDHGNKYSIFSYQNKDKIEYYIKGAPEVLLGHCDIKKEDERSINLQLEKLTDQGLRVLAVVKKTTSLEHVLKEIGGATFCCLIALEDPVRKEVSKAISECRTAGINVLMMTGDHSNTSKYVGHQIGLNTREVLTGNEINSLHDQALFEKLKTIQIISRVEPQQKLRIVEILQKRKKIVAMTGDGVNDAPSLKAAHIGIAMGKQGTDVARESSSIVLLDDDFSSIVGGIRMGRRISANMEKAMTYALSVHIPIIGLALTPFFSSQFPILLLPIHIVFLELIIDPVSSVAFETEQAEKDIMSKPPKRVSKKLFSRPVLVESIFDGSLVLITVLSVTLIHNRATSLEEIRANSFFTLILCNMLLALSKLSLKDPIWKILWSHNPVAKSILAISFISLLFCLYSNSLQTLFSFKAPEKWYLLQSIASSSLLLIIIEFKKRWKQKTHSKVLSQEKSFQKKKK